MNCVPHPQNKWHNSCSFYSCLLLTILLHLPCPMYRLGGTLTTDIHGMAPVVLERSRSCARSILPSPGLNRILWDVSSCPCRTSPLSKPPLLSKGKAERAIQRRTGVVAGGARTKLNLLSDFLKNSGYGFKFRVLDIKWASTETQSPLLSVPKSRT